jgi:tetratricopeptide (TPR) repeat protein
MSARRLTLQAFQQKAGRFAAEFVSSSITAGFLAQLSLTSALSRPKPGPTGDRKESESWIYSLCCSPCWTLISSSKAPIRVTNPDGPAQTREGSIFPSSRGAVKLKTAGELSDYSSHRTRFLLMSIVVNAILFALVGLASVRGECIPLIDGQSFRVPISTVKSACFVVNLPTGDAAQLIASQPADLEIRLHNGETAVVADGFEFGTESLTVITAGENHIEVRALPGSLSSPAVFIMSRNSIPLQRAILFRNAENRAASSKHSGEIKDINDSLRIWQDLGDHNAAARTYLKLGDAVLENGTLIPAREAYETALALCLSGKDIRCAAEAANNSGFVSQQLGDFDASMARLGQAAEDWKTLGDSVSENQTLSNMGLLFRQIGDYQHAINLYDQASRRLPRRAFLARAIVANNVGYCYQFLAEYGKARLYFERALAVESVSPGGGHDAVRARLNLGHNFMLQGDAQKAVDILRRAVTDASALDDRPALANALNNLGQALLLLHRVENGEDSLREALRLHQILGDRRLIASDLHYLGMAAFSRGDTDSAKRLLMQALDLRLACSLRDAAADSLYSLSVVERDNGNQDEAARFAERALVLLESVRARVPGADLRASFYSQKRRFFDLLVDITIASGNREAAEAGLIAAERGRARALLDTLAEGSILGKLPGDLGNRRALCERQIDLLSLRLATATAENEAGLRRQVDSLVAEDEAIEADIRQNITSQGVGKPLSSVDDLRRGSLPADGALIEFHLGPDRSYLWLVQPSGVHVFPLPPRATIESRASVAVQLFGSLYDRRRFPARQAEFERAMRSLSRTLLGPLSGVALPRLLVIVPDGILNRVPFAALLLPSTSTGLGLTHDIICVPAASFLLAGRAPRSTSSFPKSLLALVDPIYSMRDPRAAGVSSGGAASPAAPDLARLPYAAELDEAALLIPPSRRLILRGFDAVPGNLLSLRLRDYGVLHFSTHAFIDDRIPELSRIALSMVDRSGRPVNGFLRPSHIAEFRLEGSIVVLSACDSALGKNVVGEGLAGLTASLFRAGAAQLLLTLTAVDAEGSSEFLKSVYASLFSRSNVSMEHSLTLARRSLASSGRWSDPYYWASFSLYGRPSTL